MSYWADDVRKIRVGAGLTDLNVLQWNKKQCHLSRFVSALGVSICLYGLFMHHAGVLSPRELESQGGLSTLPSLKMAAFSFSLYMTKTNNSWKLTSMLN